MKRIIQKDPTGCGIACIATLSGRTYNQVRKQALKRHFISEKDLSTGYKEVKELAWYYGISIQPAQPFEVWEDVHKYALIAVELKDKTVSLDDKEWHWVIFWRKGNGDQLILDPLETVESPNYQIHNYNVHEVYPVNLKGEEPWAN